MIGRLVNLVVLLAAVAVVAVVVVVGVLGKEEEEGELPTLHVGDQWVYSYVYNSEESIFTFVITGEEVKGGKDCYVFDLSREPASYGNLTLWYDKATLQLVASQMDDTLYSYNYEPWPAPYPLEVGWALDYTETWNASETQMSGRIEEVEDVGVPAGTFRSFKMVTDQDTTATTTLWYSDEVKFMVKQLYTQDDFAMTMELVSYSVQ